MQPIESLSGEVAKSFEAICFDVDDTVTTHGTLSAEAYAMLPRLRASGLKLFAVTGRPLGFAELIARQWPVDAAVGENGAGYIAREGRGLRIGYWDDVDTRRRHQEQLTRIRQRVAREMPHVRLSNDTWARRCDLAFDVNEQENLSEDDVDALCSILREEGARVTVSSVHAHAQLSEHDKALGVAKAAEDLFDMEPADVRERFFFVGDSGNDAAAFAWFATCAGVANIAEHLGRIDVPPRFVAQARFGEGFAEIARVVLERRGS